MPSVVKLLPMNVDAGSGVGAAGSTTAAGSRGGTTEGRTTIATSGSDCFVLGDAIGLTAIGAIADRSGDGKRRRGPMTDCATDGTLIADTGLGRKVGDGTSTGCRRIAVRAPA